MALQLLQLSLCGLLEKLQTGHDRHCSHALLMKKLL